MQLSRDFFASKIGDIFLKNGDLTKEQIAIILRRQKDNRKLFGKIAVSLGFIKEEVLLRCLSAIYCTDIIDLEFTYIDPDTMSSLPNKIAESACAIPFYKDDNIVKVAISDPGDVKSIDLINSYYQKTPVEFYIAKESEILRCIEVVKNKSDFAEEDPLTFLNRTIFEAIENRASDIHFEPYENFVNVRLRINGDLRKYISINYEMWSRIRLKLKIISKLDIAESRKPQSGHTRICLAGKNIDLRISTHPGQFGENIAIRIFDLSNGIQKLDSLGFEKEDLLWLKHVLSFPSGIFLVVGPTGSGKTTTLYSLLQEIQSSSVNIMTLEDPIEYQVEGVKQLELRENGLISYADGIRSILRQDPDVMLIGEIRDEETASMAVRSALTGRLVLATLHAFNTIDAIRRLTNLGLRFEDFIPVLVGIFSQRLIKFYPAEQSERGRFPIAEYISFDEKTKEQILCTKNLLQCAPLKTFKQAATEAIKNNFTNSAEIERVLGNVDI